MVLGLVACGGNDAPAATDAPAADAPAATDAPAADAPAEDAPAADAILTEEEAAAARDAGTLVGDAKAGYDYSESTGNWYFSGYPTYKDFNADGKIKVAFACKFSGAWFTPKANSLGETVEAAGYEYHFFDANSDEAQWLNDIDSVINQDFDVVVLTPPNTALMPDVVAALQEAGIAYLTTDDPGQDAYGFYAPHYGLDDNFLFYEIGKLAAQKMADEGFMDEVKEDYSNFLFVIMDSPSVEAIHNRSLATEKAIREAYPDIPDSQILWLDCGAGLATDIEEKLAPTLQANVGTIDKWLFASGTGSAVVGSQMLLEENGFAAEDFILIETCGDPAVGEFMQTHEYAKSCILVGLASAPSGVGMGNIIIDLVENGTPIPAFTGYELLPVTAENAKDFSDKYL